MAAWPLVSRINRRKAVILAGLLAVTAWLVHPFFVQSSAMVQPPAPLAAKPAAVPERRSVMPQGFQPRLVIRDPFQTPQEALPPNPVISGNRNQPAAVSPSLTVKLTGIAVGNGNAAVILESNAGSRSYQVGDYAGQYQVRDITADSVLLAGPNGLHVLKLRGRIE